ncbi:Proteasome adapter and scaffold protein ECM29-like [Homarus americanus]|uniref:Proteasome adapter and scaffold protein ECM29-like n=1 Tax=Homarus americanus TaxID=6706 RepID=A0A8J5JWI2_HOMAM|nr:Proteasome adapter and scaffold protein ECM29-like [Homarus americanus]
MTTPAVHNLQDELLLVERVFLRIGSAATDDVLQEELLKFLSPVILKLASPHEPVRKKNFSIIYIKMGYPRLDINKQVELLPSMLNSLEGKPAQHQDSLLLLMVPVFGHMKIPETAEKTASLFGLRERPGIAKLLLDFMLDILLLPYGATPLSQQRVNEGAQDNSDGPPVPGVPAGMSIHGFKRVMGETTPKPEDLEKLKVSVIKFLSSEVLPPLSVVLQLIVGAADTRFSVANAADLQLKRIDGSVDWNSSAVIAPVYVLFLGTLMPKDKTPVDKFKNPANTRIRLKLMPYLLKSKEACNYAPLALKVFFECLWGQNSNTKLKQQGVTFLHHIAFNAIKEKLAPVGSVLFGGVVKVIEEEKCDARLRSLAYGALAKLSVKLPNLLLSHHSQLHYLQTLMNALTQEEGDVLLSVQEALSMVAPVCKQLNPSSQDELCILLSDHVLHHNPQLRRTAVHYAASVFPPDHVPSRFILMVATGDNHDDIRIESRRQLYKAIKEAKDGTPTYQAPPFSAVIGYVLERVDSLPKSKWHDVANQPVPFSLPVMEQMLKYLEHCLEVEAGNHSGKEQGLFWSDPPTVGKLVHKIVEEHQRKLASGAKIKPQNPFMRYVGFAELAANAWSASALESILRVVAVAPELFIDHYSLKMDWIRKFIVRGSHYGEVAAHLFGVVAGQVKSQQEFEKVIYHITNMKNLRVDSQESCVLALGHSYAYNINSMKKYGVYLEDWPAHESVVQELVGQLLSGNSPIQNALVISLGEMARQSPLPLPVGVPEGDKKPVSSLAVVNYLIKVFNNKKLPSKVREQAIATCGYFCVGQQEFPHKKKVLEALLALAKETNEIEVHFAVGESLADCALGTESPSARNLWTDDDPMKEKTNEDREENMEEGGRDEKEKDTDEAMEKDFVKSDEKTSHTVEEAMDTTEGEGAVVHGEAEKDVLTWLLGELLDKYVRQTQPSVRQATCIWLLALLKRCRKKPIIQQRLSGIQQAFMSLLGDNNATRQSMVEGLVQTLTEGKRTIQNVTDDTKIFQEGEMGKAPSGGQLSTYRELCSLATDLNQPDLIYKFMNLANHNSVWNSRKGAAFGFGTLASQAGSQLEPYLPQIVPKLYRYQHDPTPKIQQPMAAIWNALVTDNAKTIEKYYDPILCDLITNLTHSSWRVRESSCHALTDLLRRQPASKALHRITEIWTILFRVRDDIKESVRQAAEKTLQALSKSCIKVCEGTGEESEEMLKEVLPTLLTSGITSTVSEVRSVSLQTVSKLCRSGGSLVRPHLGTLVPALLEALSGLESQALSYTSVRLNDDDREKLDIARVAAARSTPMMDTLNYVLQFVDESSLEKLVGGLVDVLKSSVGLTSRAGAAHVVETLTHTCPAPLEKYTGKLLAALVNGLSDRNAVVRKVYANAIGNLVKTAKASSVEKILTKLQTWYLEKEDDSVRMSGALTIRSMHAQNSDIMKQHACQAMPLAFLAMHAEKTIEGDPGGVEIWDEIWSDNTPGTESAVRLYLNEIILICEQALQNSNWAMKAQAGRALSTVSQKLGPSMNDALVTSLVTLLINSLQGRTWIGKESLVTALSNVAMHTKSILSALKYPDRDELLVEDVVKVLTREASKEKMEYKIHAIKALTTVLDKYQIDRFEQVFNICLPYLTHDKQEQEDADDVERNKKEESLRWDLIDEMVHSLGRAWPLTKDTQEKYSEQVVEMLNNSASRVPRKTQLSIVGALKHFWGRHFLLQELPGSLGTPLFDPLLHHSCKIFNYCLGVAKFYSLRRESLVVLNEFLEKVKVCETLVVRLRMELLSGVEEARRDAQPDVQALAASAHRMLLLESRD